jgi:hypothetical protein
MYNMDSFQKIAQTEYSNLIVFSFRILNNFHYTESEEKKMSDLINFYSIKKNFGLLYIRTGAGAGAA